MLKTFLLSILLVSSTASASADLTGVTRSRPQYAGMFLRESPGGAIFFAAFDVPNNGVDDVEFIGIGEGGKVYMDESREATLQFRCPGKSEWAQEMASFQSRREPLGRVSIRPGATGRVYVRWGEINAIIRPQGTRYRYILRDTKGREYITGEFAIQDQASSLETRAFPGEIKEDVR